MRSNWSFRQQKSRVLYTLNVEHFCRLHHEFLSSRPTPCRHRRYTAPALFYR